MSRVFLAEETLLGRQVVLKLLPPEMGAAVSIDRFERDLVEGGLAELDRRPDAAATAYRSWYDETGQCGAGGLFDLAGLANQAGRTDSALALYERGFAAPSMQRLQLDAAQLAPALKRSGELYETKDDRRIAAERYQRFVELWKNADPVLQPAVREIRQRLAHLSTEPGA